jgi:hypothetical protein
MNEMTPDEFWAILHSMPEPGPVTYRLYYNDLGDPVIYSMEDLPGNYIEVDAEAYAIASFNVKVVNNALIRVEPKIVVHKLQANTAAGITCHPADVCIVVDHTQDHIKWSLHD